MKRTREEALATREMLLDRAEIVFFEKGVTETTLSDIADAAGVTRGAIYYHFKNKADLFLAMVSRVQLPLQAVVEAGTDPQAADPLGSLQAALATCLRELSTNTRSRHVFNVLFTKCEYSGPMGALQQRLTDMAQEARQRLARGLRSAVDKGQLPADLDTERGAVLLHATISGVFRDWLMNERCIALHREAGRIAEAALDMLRFSPALRR